LKNTLLAELGRWPVKHIPTLARQIQELDINVKGAVHFLRTERLKKKRGDHEE
jgi:hypothetical protein